MKGKYKIVVSNKKLHYELVLTRNITVIQGQSATGKTTLVDMIRQENNFGQSSGVNISSAVPCVAVDGRNWEIMIRSISRSIIFIDEENGFIKSEAFAGIVKNSDNYFVLVTRENLYNLPYSVEEIYGIHSSGKYQSSQKIYHELYHIYGNTEQVPVAPHTVMVEDSNSGYQFFASVCEDRKQQCVSAGGKSNIRRCLLQMADEEKTICVIADGAAIGAEMSNLYQMAMRNPKLFLYLPESFEWIILAAGVIEDNEIPHILDEPEAYIESTEYYSWERFFTKLLTEKTKDSYLQYKKSLLNPNYLQPKIKEKILASIPGLSFE